MNKQIKDRTGEIRFNNQGLKMEIINYRTNQDIDVKFDNGYISYNKKYVNFKRGLIYNYFSPIVCNKGYFGIGNFIGWDKKLKKHNKTYRTWHNLLLRCYDEKRLGKFETYRDCYVCDEWLNYQNFAKWFDENYIEDYQLDKDILIKGNKCYSPETCCFVPQEINSLFTKRQNKRGNYPIGVTLYKIRNLYIAQINKYGKRISLGKFLTMDEAFQAYKIAKEEYIKEVANNWKDKISKNVYDALINYEVEITD